jgi:hypothetical protein
LCARGKQGIAIGESPAVILNVGELDASRARGFGERKHFGELINVTAVNNKVECDGDAMALEPFENPEFVCVGFCARDFVGGFFAGSLKAQLKVIQAGLDESFEPRFVERQAGSDEIYVEAGSASGMDELEDVRACKRLAAGEIGLKHGESGGFAEDAGPLFGGEFYAAGLKFERIRAVDTVKRAAMS